MKDLPNVLTIGYGQMGHAMEALLEDSCNLSIWDKFPPPGFVPADLQQSTTDADIIFLCIPVSPHEEILKQIKPWIKPSAVLLSIAKGLDPQGRTAAQVMEQTLSSQQNFGVIYGPMIAKDLSAGRYGFAQFACRDMVFFTAIAKLFSGSRLSLVASDDMVGISWSVILKNIYALTIGIADELKLGDNVRGYLSVAALGELKKIVRSMGGQTETPYQLAGLGDLITTATSEHSHHHQLGRRLARGECTDIEGEGIHTLEMVEQYQHFSSGQYPLFTLASNAVKAPEKTKELINNFLEQGVSEI